MNCTASVGQPGRRQAGVHHGQPARGWRPASPCRRAGWPRCRSDGQRRHVDGDVGPRLVDRRPARRAARAAVRTRRPFGSVRSSKRSPTGSGSASHRAHVGGDAVQPRRRQGQAVDQGRRQPIGLGRRRRPARWRPAWPCLLAASRSARAASAAAPTASPCCGPWRPARRSGPLLKLDHGVSVTRFAAAHAQHQLVAVDHFVAVGVAQDRSRSRSERRPRSGPRSPAS